MRELHLVVVDTETGGLDPAEACIIELAAAHVVACGGDVQAYDRFNVRMFPDRPINPQAAEVNGYTIAEWQNTAADRPIAAMEFLHWLGTLPGDLIWCGSNVSGFDLPFMRSDFARIGFAIPGKPKFTHRTLNTESLCFPLFARGDTEGCGLRHLRTWAGLPGEQSHTASQDVSDTIEVLRAYFQREVFK